MVWIGNQIMSDEERETEQDAQESLGLSSKYTIITIDHLFRTEYTGGASHSYFASEGQANVGCMWVAGACGLHNAGPVTSHREPAPKQRKRPASFTRRLAPSPNDRQTTARSFSPANRAWAPGRQCPSNPARIPCEAYRTVMLYVFLHQRGRPVRVTH